MNRSLQIDPNFARAWMVLGSCYAIALRWTDNWDETHALYEKYMRRAVELDPMDAEAHAGLGFALAHDGDLKQAEAESAVNRFLGGMLPSRWRDGTPRVAGPRPERSEGWGAPRSLDLARPG